MTVSNPHPSDGGRKVTLSTGETIELPVSLDATMTAVVLPADRERVAALLPAGLSPTRAGRGTAPVGLLSVEYHDVGDGALEPYDEFAVIVGATPGAPSGIPYLSPLRRNDGYVWYMPVTREPARAFGAEIWGYPKVVADIDIEDSKGRRRTTVTIDGDRFLTMAVERPRTVAREDAITAYAVKDGTLLRVRGDLSGDVGIWPYTRRFSYALGDHPNAERLRELDLGDRAFARFYADGVITFGPGDPVDDRRSERRDGSLGSDAV